jgi:hypothetical protein
MTVFIRNAENLAQLLPKVSRISDGNEKFKNVFLPFRAPLNRLFWLSKLTQP